MFMNKRLYVFISLLISVLVSRAQFVDIDWSQTDTIVPRYSGMFDLGRDFRLFDYAFTMEYQETSPATKEEIKRYNIDRSKLSKDFATSSRIGIDRKKGVLNVEVFPFALREGKVIKLTSFKPTLNKTSKLSVRKTQATITTQTLSETTQDDNSRYTAHSLLASGHWVKIRVNDAGVYELTKSKLSSMGFSVASKVRLYGYNLPVLPESNIEDIADDLTEIPLWRKDNGSVLFYSCGPTKWTRPLRASEFTHFNNPYSHYIYYFITESQDNTATEFPVEESASASTDVETFYDYAVIESDEYSFLNSGRMFFEEYDYANGNKKSYKLELPGIASENAVLDVQFAAAGTTTSRLSVSQGETVLGTLAFKKLADYYYGNLNSKKMDWNSASESNTLILTHTRNSGTSGHLDYIRASYLRKLEMADRNYLAFRPSSSGTFNYKISGATASTRVWRVSSPETTCEIAGSFANGIYSATATSSLWNKDEFVAVNTDKTYPSPEIVGQISNQDLHSLSGIDFVIITPANGAFVAQAQRLADAHTAKEGMRCYVTTADKVYNEFSSGTPDATAYRRFMKMLYDKAETDEDAPKNLLLFGNGVWDNRFVTSGMSHRSQDDHLLCYESDSSLSTLNSYVCEEYFALLDDGEGKSVINEKSDIGVGRIPVTTVSEAKQVVDKLIRYINNEETGAWKNTICILADDGNGNTHMKDADDMRSSTVSLYPEYNYRRIYWDAYTRVSTATGHSYPDAYADINKQMQDGALIMNYTGHGAAYCLSHEQVLKRSDFAEWTSPKLPLWITAACDVSPFDMNEENIGVTALLNNKGAAMGMVTTTRTTYSSSNRNFNQKFMQYVLGKKADGKRYTIGEAVQMAKNTAVSTAINKTLFVLLGDPAITLATPSYKVKIDKFNEKNADTDTPESINAGGIVSIEGYITDEDGNIAENFNGIVSPTVYDNIEKVQCKYNAQNDQEEESYNASPYSYFEHIRTLYVGSDSVRNGRFKLLFPVPLDINYSNEAGMISLYAANNSKDIEAQGQFDNFIVGGTSSDISNNTDGPEITLFLNTENFQSGDKVNESPLLIAYLSDSDGINTTGNGIGHDITAIIDNSESLTYSLNSYFTPYIGDYTQGSISFSLPALSAGKHKLQLRAFDILNNPSSQEIEFEVVKGIAPTIFELLCISPVYNYAVFTIVNDHPQSELGINISIYDISGRKIWETNETETSQTNQYTYTWDLTTSDNNLQPGIYICKATISTTDGGEASKAVKFLVLGK